MKKNKIGRMMLLALLLMSIISSCKKEDDYSPMTTALTITNAIAGVPATYTLYTRFYYGERPTNFNSAPLLANGSSLVLRGYAGHIPLAFSPRTDTTEVLCQTDVELEHGNIYSLFLMGTEDEPDYLFQKEEFPPNYAAADSLMGVRFINLSKGSEPISIHLKSPANEKFEDALAYKESGDYHTLPMGWSKIPEQRYVFEIWDEASGRVLATYTLGATTGATALGAYQSKHLTIAFIGTPNGLGTLAQKALLINPK